MIKAKKSLGQNFLIDKNIIDKIINTVSITGNEVLEVGPGTGNLTKEILKKNPSKMYLVEKDTFLAENLEDSLTLMSDIIEINETIYQSIEQLIISLRELPRDIPPISEETSEEEILEHPVMDLIMSEMEWLAPIWPIISHITSMDLVSFEDLGDESSSMAGGHKDLVP